MCWVCSGDGEAKARPVHLNVRGREDHRLLVLRGMSWRVVCQAEERLGWRLLACRALESEFDGQTVIEIDR